MCLTPITKKMPDGTVKSFPCGKCLECVKKFQNDWSFRLCYEATKWQHMYFFTLTYDNNNVPFRKVGDLPEDKLNYVKELLSLLPPSDERSRILANASGSESAEFYRYISSDSIDATTRVPSAARVDVCNWIKRVRTNWKRKTGKDLVFKYFICSEYGPNTLRPHYHGIIFTNSPFEKIKEMFFDTWNFGNVADAHEVTGVKGINDDIGKVTAYVAKYCCKPEFYENPWVRVGLVEKPKRFISNGIGAGYEEEIKKAISSYVPPSGKTTEYGKFNGYDEYYLKYYLECLKIHKGEYSYSCPRYWKDKVIPHTKKKYEKIVLKNGKAEKTFVLRDVKDRENHLSNAIDMYVEDLLVRDYQTRMEQYRDAHPDATDREMVVALEEEDVATRRERAQSQKDRFLKYYFKKSRKWRKY